MVISKRECSERWIDVEYTIDSDEKKVLSQAIGPLGSSPPSSIAIKSWIGRVCEAIPQAATYRDCNRTTYQQLHQGTSAPTHISNQVYVFPLWLPNWPFCSLTTKGYPPCQSFPILHPTVLLSSDEKPVL